MASYLFIDGGYLRSRLKYISKHFAIDLLDFDYQVFGAVADKKFYYDCLPARGPNEKTDDYDRRVEPERNLFKTIKSLPGYHVFLGEAVRSSGEIVQKGVDIRIAVDMLTHSFRGVIDRAILFAGDRDFEPLVSALVQQGLYITVGYHPTSVAEELLDAADVREEYDTLRLWNYATRQFKEQFPAPSRSIIPRSNVQYRDNVLVRTGMYKTEEVRLYKPDWYRLFLPCADDYAGNKQYQCIAHPNEAVILKLLAESDIEVAWS
jgi:uncharacterized LabA/DUF88 family protein